MNDIIFQVIELKFPINTNLVFYYFQPISMTTSYILLSTSYILLSTSYILLELYPIGVMNSTRWVGWMVMNGFGCKIFEWWGVKDFVSDEMKWDDNNFVEH